MLCGDTSVRCLRPSLGRAPTGSLPIDMPQLVPFGSLERWAMCPMFAAPTPIVRHRNPRWPGVLTLMCLWARLSIITCLMRLVGGCRPTDLYDLKVHTYEPRDDGQDLPRVCRGAGRARAGSRRWQRERLCGRAGRLAVRNGRTLRGNQSRACRSRRRSDARICPGRRVGTGASGPGCRGCSCVRPGVCGIRYSS